MSIAIITLFGFAVFIGLIMFMYVIGNKRIPRILPLIHGPLAILGIVLLCIYTFSYPSKLLYVAVILFIFAALGGLTMLYKDLTGKKIPKLYAVGHGLLAFGTFLYLVISTVAESTP